MGAGLEDYIVLLRMNGASQGRWHRSLTRQSGIGHSSESSMGPSMWDFVVHRVGDRGKYRVARADWRRSQVDAVEMYSRLHVGLASSLLIRKQDTISFYSVANRPSYCGTINDHISFILSGVGFVWCR